MSGRFIVARALVLLLLLSGCAQSERDYIIGDERFSASERAGIEAGASFLMQATGRTVPEIRWEPLPEGTERNVIARGALGKDVGGVGDVGDFRVILDADQINEKRIDIRAVAAHELGHGLGLEHHVEAGLMNPMATHLVWSDADESECLQKEICRQ